MPLSAALVRRLLVRSSRCLYKAEGGESEERRARAAVGGACASSLVALYVVVARRGTCVVGKG